MNVGKSIFFTTDIKILYDRDKKENTNDDIETQSSNDGNIQLWIE